jgi:hypothetical protein
VVLRDRGGQALERLGARVERRLVVRAREPHGQQRGGLGLDREVCEHVGHSGLVGEARAERAPVRRVPRRPRDGRPHAARRADHAVQARVVDHLDDRRHAAAGLADHARPRAAQLDLARRVRAVTLMDDLLEHRWAEHGATADRLSDLMRACGPGVPAGAA